MASKRSLDSDHVSTSRMKKEKTDNHENEDSFAKLLFPSFVAGLVIGKEGGLISELMNQTQTNIKFSPGRELYPGTLERVCIVIGQVSNIVSAVRGILERIRNSDTGREQEASNCLKMLVSNTASGMVIGKSGSTVKMIQQDFNVRIQITCKDETRGLPERTLTIMSDNLDYILSAFQNILERIVGDPDGEKWRRLVSYSGYNMATPTSSSKSSGNLIGTHLSTNSLSSNPSNQVDYSSFLQAFLQSSQSHSYAQPGSNSFPRLNSTGSGTGQGVIGSGSSTNFLQSDSSNHQMGLSNAMISYMYSQSLSSVSSGGYFTAFPPVMIDGVNLSIPGATLSTYEVAIPEVMVNTIFGADLQLVADIMQSTGTRIELSNKGDYITGTYNRKLTIVGPILSVQAAHLIVMQRVAKEQDAFRKQGLI